MARAGILASVAFAIVSGSAETAAPLQASCQLQSAGNKIKRVIHLQFDNVHLRRDNPNVPSDLEQMPHLLNCLLDNGTVSGNHFTPLISHTAQDIVTAMTGLYGERFGFTVANRNPRGSQLNTQASTDWLGIAIHCAQGGALCADGAPDTLPDEPGGYTGFKALYGNINVQPAISPGGPVKDLDGNVIADKFGHPGFPNTFDPLATQTLGYAATMREAGVPVVYFYIADAHDNEVGPSLSGEQTFGPGEAPYVAQLKLHDTAFQKFFDRLAADGITKNNTLFVITADENDHFVGGPPSPANCDRINVPCTYAKKGEIDAFIDRLLLTQRQNTTPFSIHFDDAPTFYVNGNPAPTAPVTRTLEHDVNALTVVSPITGNNERISALLAD